MYLVSLKRDWTGTIWNLKTNLNYVGNSQANIAQYVEQVTTDLSSTNDVVALTEQLYHEGYVTHNFVNDITQYFTPTSWKDISQQDQIQSLKLLLFHVVTQDTTSTPGQDDLITTEVDTITYTNAHYYWSSQTNDWTLLQDSGTGIWQVDNLQNLDNQSRSSSSGSSSSSSIGATGSPSGSSVNGSTGPTGSTNSTVSSGSSSIASGSGTTGETVRLL